MKITYCTKRFALTLTSIFGLVMNAQIAQAARVVKAQPAKQLIWFSSPIAEQFKTRDNVCAYQNDRKMLCGEIAERRGKELLVHVSQEREYPANGGEVSLRVSRRGIASTEELADQYRNPRKDYFLDISGGMTAGTNYYYPMVHIQLAVTERFSLGVMPIFASYTRSNASLTAVGGYLTADYYQTHYAFKGLYFEGGVGAFNIKESASGVSATTNPTGVMGAVGWRAKALGGLGGLDVGLAAGLQYIFLETTPIDISFHGLLPLASAYLGYSF